jgi:hypothetical protein
MSKHQNNGKCQKCHAIIDRYPGFHAGLRAWFEELQAKNPEAHVACAGRGQDDQEMLFHRKATRAHFGQSAHNYNAALDLFEMGGETVKDIYEIKWFKRVIGPNVPEWMEWYGKPGSKFWELPHVEVRDWKVAAKNGELKLVEAKKNVA